MNRKEKKEENQKTVRNHGGVTEIHLPDFKTTETVDAIIHSQPTASILIVICFAILLISLNVFRIVGWILLVLMMFTYVFGRNKKQITFYNTFFLIHALDDDTLVWKVDYPAVKEWSLKRSLFSMSTLTVETMGQNGQKIETRCWNYSTLKKALLHSMPSKVKLIKQ